MWKEFKHQSHLKGHVDSYHGDRTIIYKCELCPGINFKTRRSLQTHNLRKHPTINKSKEKPSFTCAHCGKFGVKTSIKEHMERFHIKCYYKCKMCSKKFKVIRKFRMHMKLHKSQHESTKV